MIVGSHVILYAKDAEKARRFFREVLRLRHVDAGDGWLIFALPPAELGVHPDARGGTHELYLMCDDVERTAADLRTKGVAVGPVMDRGWGLVTTLRVPGLGQLGLYQPRHPTAIRMPKPRARAATAKRRPAAAKPRRLATAKPRRLATAKPRRLATAKPRR